MKKIVAICILILIMLEIGSCQNNYPTASPEASKAPASTPLASAESFISGITDNELSKIVERAIKLLDFNLPDSYVKGFASANEISETNLLKFFYLSTPIGKMDRWQKKEDGLYHIPRQSIIEELDSYFEGYNFDPESIVGDNCYYDKTEDAVVTKYVYGDSAYYGYKIDNVKISSKDTVRIDIGFGDLSCITEPFFRMKLTLKIVDGGYRYISFEEVEPNPRQTPGPYETAKEAYQTEISRILVILDELKERWPEGTPTDYEENSFSGALEDLDGDGQEELIIAYYAKSNKARGLISAYYYRIYTFKAGTSVLLDGDILFADVGATRGGLSIIVYGGELCLCIWNSNSHPGDGDLIQYLSGKLLSLNDELTLKHTYDLTFHSLRGEISPDDARLLIDDRDVSFEDFLLFKNSFDNPVKELCTVGKGLTNYRLSQLYEDLIFDD